jgi:hypothetical protein
LSILLGFSRSSITSAYDEPEDPLLSDLGERFFGEDLFDFLESLLFFFEDVESEVEDVCEDVSVTTDT